MSTTKTSSETMSNYRWIICSMLFFATAVNYLDRQVLSLTWKDFIAPEFHWTDTHYGTITAIFSIIYAIANLFAGRFVDWLGSKKGYLWAIAIWSLGACLHALCGWATEMSLGLKDVNEMIAASGALTSTIAITSVYYFIAARIVLAVGESGNFPAAIKVTAEYFPKKDRAFATSIFNAGSTIGALIAPVSIPPLASYFKSIGVGNGWEMAFIVIGALGFIWMGLWMFMYKKPQENPQVKAAELAYIQQDKEKEEADVHTEDEPKISLWQCFKFRQTWAIIFGKFLTDGVWWFFLFWTPAYISDVYGFSSDSATAQLLIFVLYAITMLSIYGGKLPTIIINKTGKNPYVARMQAMLIFAVFPLLAVGITPILGKVVDNKGKAASMLMFGSILLIVCHLTFAFILPLFKDSAIGGVLIAYVTILILGASFSLVPASLWPSVPKLVDQKVIGSAYALIFWIQNIGLWLFPLLIGKVLDNTNPQVVNDLKNHVITPEQAAVSYDYTWPLVMLACLGGAALVIGVILKRVDKVKGLGLELPNVQQ